MQQTNKRLEELFNRWYHGTATAAEERELRALLKEAAADEILPPLLQEAWNNLDELMPYGAEREDALISNILSRYPAVQEPVPVRRLQPWWWAAASVLLLAGAGLFAWLHYGKRPLPTAGQQPLAVSIPPVRKGITLTLSNGRQIILDSVGNGIVTTQNGSRAVLANGQLSYQHTGHAGEPAAYHTISVPRGRQVRLVLPDQTSVWLNAGSSLTYPTAFTGSERKVTVTGEAYFEVNARPERPFRVTIPGTGTVEVLGTRFNINAYTDEATVKTTLLEGRVRVLAGHSQNGGRSVVLQPGQQARIPTGGQAAPQIVVAGVNTDQVTAWKNGLFNFEDASLEDVMRQLSRWYDIEVVYEKGIPDIHFAGEMSRNISLEGLLKILEKTGVHFRMENNRRLVVAP